jgi:hypothetical protein
VVGFWPTTYQHEHVHSMFEISQKCFFWKLIKFYIILKITNKTHVYSHMNFDKKNVEQQDLNDIICNYNCWIPSEKHFLIMLILYQQSLYI